MNNCYYVTDICGKTYSKRIYLKYSDTEKLHYLKCLLFHVKAVLQVIIHHG